MAANNYFGFTHGGTQYSSPATTYQTNQTAYAAVAHPQTYAQTPARTTAQTGYEGYQNTAASYGFPTGSGVANRTQDNTGVAAAAAVSTAGYDTSAYANFRPASTNNSGFDGTKSYYQQQQQNQSQQQTPGYDAALYSAATMYVQQQQANSSSLPKQTSGWNSFKKPGFGMNKMNKPKMPPKPQQLHYCDVCKISCAGPQTYREHLDGQKHKKKEAAAKTSTVVPPSRQPGNSLRCELCDVTCTGADAYAAHIRGAKHQKVVKLHTKLGKPIPSVEPTVLGTPPATVTKGTAAGGGSAPVTIKALVTPKISFIGGTTLNTTGTASASADTSTVAMTTAGTDDALTCSEEGNGAVDDSGFDLSKYDEKADIQPVGLNYIEELKNDEGKVVSFQCKLCDCRFNDPNAKEMHMKGRRHRLQYKKKVDPELVVDVKPSLRQRKIHEEKVRRQHIKEDSWRRRDEDRWREEMRQVAVPPAGAVLFSNQATRRDRWAEAFDDEVSPLRRMMEDEERLYWEERRRYEEEIEYFEWYRRYGRDPRGIPPPMSRNFPGQSMSNSPMRRPDSVEDRHVQAKHSEIYPNDEGLQAVQKIVSNTEKALKQVSDILADSQNTTSTVDVKAPVSLIEPAVNALIPEVLAIDAVKKEPESPEKKDEGPARVLKGVMRVGVLAKGLLLKGDADVQLVVLCSEKPTVSLLQSVASNLAPQLAKINEDGYTITIVRSEASIIVSAVVEPKINVHITLTSPVVREVGKGEEGGM